MLLIGIFYLYLSIKALQEVPSLLVVFACALCNAENFEVTVASLLQDLVLCSKKNYSYFHQMAREVLSHSLLTLEGRGDGETAVAAVAKAAKAWAWYGRFTHGFI